MTGAVKRWNWVLVTHGSKFQVAVPPNVLVKRRARSGRPVKRGQDRNALEGSIIAVS